MITCRWLDARGRYERRMYGWADDAAADSFRYTVRLEDDGAAIEVAAECTLAPGYEIRCATGRRLDGEVEAASLASLGRLGGTRMVAGYTRRLAEAVGEGDGAALLIDGMLEVARLARQVAKLPLARTTAIAPNDARGCWQLDTTSWADLPGSCFTYSDAGRRLLDTRPVTAALAPSFYSPAPGATRIFVRRKTARVLRSGRRLDLFASMHDDVHGFDLHYEIDADAGTIVAADSVTSRLPYRGLCDEPQARIRAMIGQRVDALLRRRSQSLLGGEAGCAQLFDLSGDALKLLELV